MVFVKLPWDRKTENLKKVDFNDLIAHSDIFLKIKQIIFLSHATLTDPALGILIISPVIC
jgi:hypothetical protein